MARVVLPSALRALAGGSEAVDVEARSVRELLRALEQRFPGLSEPLRTGMAIAIDGDILLDAALEPLSPASVVHFLPAIRGG